MGQALAGGFGGAVGGLANIAFAGDGTEIDDRSAAATDHARGNLARDHEGRGQIRIDCTPPGFASMNDELAGTERKNRLAPNAANCIDEERDGSAIAEDLVEAGADLPFRRQVDLA